MGLDSVEVVFAIEDAFGIAISNEDAERLVTPGVLADYLERRLRSGEVAGCLEQRAFYRLRRAGKHVLDRPRADFTPDTPWSALLHDGQHQREWKLLERAVNITPWPRLAPLLSFGATSSRVRDTAQELATTAPAALMSATEGWNRQTIEAIVGRLMAEVLGITKFRWTDRFGEDLKVD